MLKTAEPVSVLTAVQVMANVTLWLSVLVSCRWATRIAEEWGMTSGNMTGWIIVAALHTCGIVAWIIWSWRAEQGGRTRMPVMFSVAIVNIAVMIGEGVAVPWVVFFGGCHFTIG